MHCTRSAYTDCCSFPACAGRLDTQRKCCWRWPQSRGCRPHFDLLRRTGPLKSTPALSSVFSLRLSRHHMPYMSAGQPHPGMSMECMVCTEPHHWQQLLGQVDKACTTFARRYLGADRVGMLCTGLGQHRTENDPPRNRCRSSHQRRQHYCQRTYRIHMMSTRCLCSLPPLRWCGTVHPGTSCTRSAQVNAGTCPQGKASTHAVPLSSQKWPRETSRVHKAGTLVYRRCPGNVPAGTAGNRG